MSDWHTDSSVDESGAYCGTTHCWAGWIVAHAGADGRKLEKALGTPVAALRILHESSTIRVGMVRFFEGNEKAMEEIKKVAELEMKNGL